MISSKGQAEGSQQAREVFGQEALTAEFIRLTTRIARLAGQEGIEITPFKNSELPYFSLLSDSEKKRVIGLTSAYGDILSSAMDAGAELRDGSRLVWFALKVLGYRHSSDLFKYVPFGTTFEVYDLDFLQVFRSLSFFEVCSYTLEDLYCRPWTDLYRRPQAVQARLLQYAEIVLTQSKPSVVSMQMDEHIIEELDSEDRNRVGAWMKYTAPLFTGKSQTPSALILIEDTRLIDAQLGFRFPEA